MIHEDFMKVKACVGTKFTVNGEDYWLGQICWVDAYLTGYQVKGDETISEFQKLDVHNEDSMEHRMEKTFGCCVVERIFYPN